MLHTEIVVEKRTVLGYISTESMAADIFTKFFPDRKLVDWQRNLGLICVGDLQSLREQIGCPGCGYTVAVARKKKVEGAPGSGFADARNGALDPYSCAIQGSGIGKLMSVSHIPGTQILRRSVGKAQAGYWGRCVDATLRTRSFVELQSDPRADSWEWTARSWAGSMAQEFLDYKVAHASPRRNEQPRDMKYPFRVGTVRVGRIFPKVRTKVHKLRYREAEIFDMCVVIGKAMGTCKVPGGSVEVQSRCLFCSDDLSAPNMDVSFIGNGTFMIFEIHVEGKATITVASQASDPQNSAKRSD